MTENALGYKPLWQRPSCTSGDAGRGQCRVQEGAVVDTKMARAVLDANRVGSSPDRGVRGQFFPPTLNKKSPESLGQLLFLYLILLHTGAILIYESRATITLIVGSLNFL